jgi:hypothetical protein
MVGESNGSQPLALVVKQSQRMIASYSCYLFDPERGIVDRRDYHASSEAEAIATAIAFSSEHTPPQGFELWMGLRQVHREAPEDKKTRRGALAT